ncbi:transposase [Nocardia neocaledoniensis]|uniref:transposase n=1 Tax=Nocardia neocaledoniensis TaxID=236511 RepID=UPI003D7BB196
MDDELGAGRSRDRPVSGRVDHESPSGHRRQRSWSSRVGNRGSDGRFTDDAHGARRGRRAEAARRPPRRNPDRVLADKVYSSAAIRELLRGGNRSCDPATIRSGRQQERSWTYWWTPAGVRFRCLQGRNAVERAFNKVKHWRGVATRYDKLACAFRAGIVMALVVEWLGLVGDMT